MADISITDASLTSETTSHSEFQRRVLVALTMGVTGAAGLIYQFVIASTLSFTLGNSTRQWALVVTFMMVSYALGGFFQKNYKRRLIETFVVAEWILLMLGGFAPLILQWLFISYPEQFAFLSIIYIMIIGFFVGLEIPLVMRINEQFADNLESNISETYTWDYVGGAAGGLAFVWLIQKGFDLYSVGTIAAFANLSIAAIWLGYFLYTQKVNRKLGGSMMSVLIATALILTWSWSNSAHVGASMTQRLYDDPIIAETLSPYQSIVLTKGGHPNDPDGANYEMYINGNKQFASADERIYHEMLVHPAMSLSSAQSNVLILGGGDGLALREVLKYSDVESVTLVDLDPAMIEFATTNEILAELNEGAFNDARVSSSLTNPDLNAGVINTEEMRDVQIETGATSVTCQEIPDGEGTRVSDCQVIPQTTTIGEVHVFTVDAGRFIADSADLYDVIIIDLPDPNSIELAKLYSMEFYQDVRRALSPSGTVVVQATSPYHAKETFLTIQRTMAAAGLGTAPYHANIPSFGEWGWILGSPSLGQAELYQRADTIGSFDVETSEILPANLSAALVFNAGWLTSSSNEISTLMRPSVFSTYVYEAWLTD